MLKRRLASAVAALTFASGVAHATCPGFTSFTNNTTADATAVNNNFNDVTTCFAPLASPSFTGNVGVGIGAPLYLLDARNSTTASQLHLSGNGGDTGAYFTATASSVLMSANAAFSGTTWTAKATAASIVAATQAGLNVYVDSSLISGNTYTPTQRMSLTAAGVLGVSSASASCTFTPTVGATSWSCPSDARLKKDIADAGAALPQLADIRVRDFTIKSTGDRRTGVIAQELRPSHPDMVHEGAEGLYTVDAPNPWVLVKAVQELKAENDELRARLTALESIRHASLSK